ncbi:endonuclease I family protein [Granulosicoccus antarcticus]|uniref:Extracellular ribonuclease n=1 Tax=Granulosicoccus antarcticus IMCC3135 TaxID=1192854 RepID=A0A2Z2NKY1_9GAMM|nr:endonuclease [Granulosicoccus antarcticus]ASJ70661.1 Extracellular ribonuclease [Granulosicoccus antarcticus IMCC3135]
MSNLVKKTYAFPAIAAAIATVSLLHSCVWHSSPHEQAAARAELRDRLHDQMSNQKTISNRQSWDIISSAAQTSNNTIQLFYRQIAIDKNHRASGSDQNKSDYWNREHIWPQSYGLRGTPAARDLHNLVPADRTVNTSRGNKVFDWAVEPHKECLQCKVSRTSWEPPDAVKGDIARTAFYMDVRYDGGDGTPDLSLSDAPHKDQAIFGHLNTLLQWHCIDPVSDEERQHNDVVAQAQGNRNLFVDKPQLAELLYAFDCSQGRYASK